MPREDDDELHPSYPLRYTAGEIEIRQTDAYARWFERLRDRNTRARVLVRIRRLSLGNPGDCEPVGGGVFEMPLHCGPGYRVYFTRWGAAIVVLLAGGDKRAQSCTIARARALARELREG
jgi:putative addiction module killer protein